MTSVKTLITKGLLNSGQVLIWKRRVLNSTFTAVVQPDGSLKTEDGKLHKSPSGAAKHLNGDKPVDGWMAWKVKDSGKSLAELRTTAES